MKKLGLPRSIGLKTLFEDLTSGFPITDMRFDGIYPQVIRRASEMHWTPVDVARRAAELLYRGRDTRILDVGSGAGKFCLVASATSEAWYTGVEQRPHLVRLSRAIARHYGLKRVRFIESDIDGVDWHEYTGFYLYNPFVENLYQVRERIDSSCAFSTERYCRLVRLAQFRFNAAPAGTRIVTFHGFGGEMPPHYEVEKRERWGDDYLVLWIKKS